MTGEARFGRRLRAVAAVILLALMLIVARLATLQMSGGKPKAPVMWFNGTVTTPRGSLYDNSGKLLAKPIVRTSVAVDPHRLGDENLARLKPILRTIVGDSTASFDDLAKRRGGFAWIARHTALDSMEIAELLGSCEEPASTFRIIMEEGRFYPGGSACGHITGFCGIDGIGLAGIERTLDGELRGEVAEYRIARDAPDDTVWTKPLRKRRTIELSISLDLQRRLEQQVQGIVARRSVIKASIVAVDVPTGEVLSLLNYPAFDPNAYRSIANSPGSRWLLDANDAVSTPIHAPVLVYLFLLSIRMAEGTWLDTQMVRDEFAELCAARYGSEEALQLRSLSMVIPRDVLKEYFLALEFGAMTGIELPSEPLGIDYEKVEADWASVKLTLVQAARLMAMFMDDGRLRRTTLLAKAGRDELSAQTVAEEGRKVLPAGVARVIRGLVEQRAIGRNDGSSLPGYRAGVIELGSPGVARDDGEYGVVGFVRLGRMHWVVVAASAVSAEAEDDNSGALAAARELFRTTSLGIIREAEGIR